MERGRERQDLDKGVGERKKEQEWARGKRGIGREKRMEIGRKREAG